MAGRFTSIILDAKYEPDRRPYSAAYEYCIHCGACVRRCPAGAITMDYLQDPYSFCMEYDRVTRTFGERKGVKGRPGQPDNFFCFSCPPWIAFESYSSQTPGRIPPLFPIIVCGKYEQTDQGCMMPVSLTVSHAAMDGYHISQFFDRLQENLDTVRITEKV